MIIEKSSTVGYYRAVMKFKGEWLVEVGKSHTEAMGRLLDRIIWITGIK